MAYLKNLELEEIMISVLRAAYQVHESLDERGEEVVFKNQFGDTALRVDVEAENAVIDFLKKWNVPIRIISEEHGQIDISDEPKYLGILDGLDGSNRYLAARGVER